MKLFRRFFDAGTSLCYTHAERQPPPAIPILFGSPTVPEGFTNYRPRTAERCTNYWILGTRFAMYGRCPECENV